MAIRRDDSRTVLDESAQVRHLADWGPPVALVHSTGPAVLLDIRCPITAQVEVLRREAPAYLLSFASNLGALARHCRTHGIALPSLRGVRSSGEVLTAETRAACRDAWGVEPADMYSAVETGYVSFECAEHRSHHVQAESALVEVLHDDGRACEVGETGRVVVTPLNNFAMPLLRYELGDLAEVGPPCACGRTLPVLTRILGRARDMLTLPSGAKRFAHYGQKVLADISGVVQHQVVQRSRTEIEFFLVVRRPLTDAEEARIRAAVLEGLGHPFRLRLTYSTRLPGMRAESMTNSSRRLRRTRREQDLSDRLHPRRRHRQGNGAGRTAGAGRGSAAVRVRAEARPLRLVLRDVEADRKNDAGGWAGPAARE
jgi:phenylacetate-CoA ligase